ncbi:hypothetical protein HIM_07673 [Hirsutella minnesotensis 3608]|uniref:Protein-S-isoprenylcysteine O-methyltransferase n=1 Tax=Hirsutella minnesotensis 3608 TaxID=1043627 RepID=A0A0F7ZN05_9HYPO|nr:hypothetical protein HIM_07673 [Hirsutella minnesotensis 3608]
MDAAPSRARRRTTSESPSSPARSPRPWEHGDEEEHEEAADEDSFDDRNTLVASVDSFLLTANWPSYAIAHAAAFAECALVSLFFPDRAWAPFRSGPLLLALGLALVVVGQAVRSAAMLEAGASFNHQVQTRKAGSHTLVTTGIYGLMRHPSYFGFYYWSLGTQLVLGNVLCFCAYAAILWVFFNGRIKVEEAKLVEFFRRDYLDYRMRVPTMMPFIP